MGRSLGVERLLGRWSHGVLLALWLRGSLNARRRREQACGGGDGGRGLHAAVMPLPPILLGRAAQRVCFSRLFC